MKDVQSSDNYQKATEALKDKEKLLNNVMISMGDGLSIQDLDMRIVFQNKFMVDNFGDHLGEYCYKVYEKRDQICVGCPIQEAYKDGKTHKALRVGQTEKGPFRFENIASVLKNDTGEIVVGMELCRIVEDREKAFDELKKKNEEIERFNKMAVGREIKMTELKEKIKRLEEELQKK
jgi:hypothetical protein